MVIPVSKLQPEMFFGIISDYILYCILSGCSINLLF